MLTVEQKRLIYNEIQEMKEERDYAQFPKYVKEAIKIAISAIEKQISKKPTYEEIGNMYGAIKRTCTACGDVCMVSKGAKPYEHYCRQCGQALEWSENNG